jgi:hypothetical protein
MEEATPFLWRRRPAGYFVLSEKKNPPARRRRHEETVPTTEISREYQHAFCFAAFELSE